MNIYMMKTGIQITFGKALILLASCFLIFSCNEKKEQDESALVRAVDITDSADGEVWVKKHDGTSIRIKTPETADGVFETADLSPNKQFILITAPLGDGGQAWVYHIKEAKLYEIKGGFGLGKMGWLEDSRVMLHQGCRMADYCKKLESTSSKTPWLVRVTEDYSKKN